MFTCFTEWSSVINLDWFWKQSFLIQSTLWVPNVDRASNFGLNLYHSFRIADWWKNWPPVQPWARNRLLPGATPVSRSFLQKSSGGQSPRSHQQSSVGVIELCFREPLLMGKAQYSWHPCTDWFKSAAFENANITHFFTKTSYLNEENRTKPSPSVSVPCFFVTTGGAW